MDQKKLQDLQDAFSRHFRVAVFSVIKDRDPHGLSCIVIQLTEAPPQDLFFRFPKTHDDYPIEYKFPPTESLPLNRV